MRLFSTLGGRRESLLFVVDWGEHVQRGVAAVAVVGRLDVLEHGGLQLERSSALARLGRIPEAIKVYDEIWSLGKPAIAALEDAADHAEQTDGPYKRERIAESPSAAEC